MHSTRGRANLLRALISHGSLRHMHYVMRNDPLAESVAEALDLCLACKGCKAECPSGVDMAKLKFAFEAEYYKFHRRPARDYLFGYFHVVAESLSSIAPAANFVLGNSFMRSVAARIMGITPHRPFPKFSRQQARVSPRPGYPKIIFLSDAFAHYMEAQIEQAAFDILYALGFDVHILPVIGAGALLMSKGFLRAARRHAQRVLEAIKRIDPDGSLPVVGTEPPEIYALKHDYYDLLPERAEELMLRVGKVWLLEEFLIRSKAWLIAQATASIASSSEDSI